MSVPNSKQVTPDSAIYKLLKDSVDVSHIYANIRASNKTWYFLLGLTVFFVLIGAVGPLTTPVRGVSYLLALLLAFLSRSVEVISYVDENNEYIVRYRLRHIQLMANELNTMFEEDNPRTGINVYETTDVTNLKSVAIGCLVCLAHKILLVQKYLRLTKSIQPPDYRGVVIKMFDDQRDSYHARLQLRYDRLRDLGLIDENLTYSKIFEITQNIHPVI